MKAVLVSLFLLPVLAFLGCKSPQKKETLPVVKVTLNDNQIVVGEMTTKVIRLKTSHGTLDFSTEDAGELGPWKGKSLSESGRAVCLWLRNGSEFIGLWDKPSVHLKFEAGGENFDVDIPFEKLKRLQFYNTARWARKAVFRVATTFGDDFFVDVDRTRITFKHDLFVIKPFLDEIKHIEPMKEPEGSWLLEMTNGTVLETSIDQEALVLHLDMGPETITVPMAYIEYMNRLDINQYGSRARVLFARAEEQSYYKRGPDVGFGGVGNLEGITDSDDGFYTKALQKFAKEKAGKSWEKK
jgi:hypothetical protein